MKRTVLTHPISCCLVLVLALSGCGPAVRTSKSFAHLPGEDYNVAVILIDTLRPDHLGCYGYEKGQTPRIDALAQDALLFENAYTASTFTGEAVSALFTGRPPAMNETGLGWTARPTPMAENLPKLYESSGFATGIFSTSFVMRFRGFYDSFQEAELFPAVANTTALDDQLTDAALDFAKRLDGEPTFSYLHYYAPHAPYNPPAESLEAFEIDRSILEPSDEVNPAAMVTRGMVDGDPRLAELRKHYDAEIAFIDGSIGRYLDGLRDLGQLEKTIVVVLSDHGEEFMEHGFADHAWNLYEETLRIPMLVYAPGLVPAQRVADRVSICDVMPTLLRLSHLPHEKFEGEVAGKYLVRAGESDWQYNPRSGPLYASLFPESRAQLHAVHFGDFKYIAGPRWLDAKGCKQFWLLQGRMAADAKSADFQALDPWAPVVKEALFNLSDDPGEQHNLIERHGDIAEEGRLLLHEYKNAGKKYRQNSAPTVMKDPFDAHFVESALKELSEEGSGVDTESGDGDSRISPEVLESLETMGYL